jgi:hypothetical protein
MPESQNKITLYLYAEMSCQDDPHCHAVENSEPLGNTHTDQVCIRYRAWQDFEANPSTNGVGPIFPSTRAWPCLGLRYNICQISRVAAVAARSKKVGNICSSYFLFSFNQTTAKTPVEA